MVRLVVFSSWKKNVPFVITKLFSVQCSRRCLASLSYNCMYTYAQTNETGLYIGDSVACTQGRSHWIIGGQV